MVIVAACPISKVSKLIAARKKIMYNVLVLMRSIVMTISSHAKHLIPLSSFLSLLCLCVGSASFAVTPSISSDIPLNKGMQALGNGNVDDASRWFDITQRDFPSKVDAQTARVAQLLIFVANELAQVKMAKHLQSHNRVNKSADKRWSLLKKDYEKTALDSGKALSKAAQSFLDLEQNRANSYGCNT